MQTPVRSSCKRRCRCLKATTRPASWHESMRSSIKSCRRRSSSLRRAASGSWDGRPTYSSHHQRKSSSRGIGYGTKGDVSYMRALISVYNKNGLVDFARGLLELGVELFSTGGTEELLRGAGLAVRSVQDLTDFPALLGGRVKTLHPAVHAPILARRDEPADLQELADRGFAPIDIVVCNLYPFIQTIQAPGTTREAALESIDIGGVALLRAAAKNFRDVLPVCNPEDYPSVMDGLRRPAGVSVDTRQRLAAKAFQHCAVYDTCIATYLRPYDELFPDEFSIALQKVAGLRYGENPHQLAAFYRDLSTRSLELGVGSAEQLHGIPLSYNNTLDVDAA